MESFNIASFDDLTPQFVAVTINLPDGRTGELKLRLLTENDVWQIRQAITWPQPPAKDAMRDKIIYDRQDPGYLAAVAAADRRFTALAVLAALPFEVPGDSEDERIAYLQKRVGQFIYTQLTTAIGRLTMISGEELAAVANSFRPRPGAGPQSDAAAGLDAGAVAEPAEA